MLRKITIIAAVAISISPAAAAPKQGAITKAGNDLLYCVSRQIGSSIFSVRRVYPDTQSLITDGVRELAATAISLCADYYEDMAKKMGMTDLQYLQSRTFRLLVNHASEQASAAILDTEVELAGNSRARLVRTDVDNAIANIKSGQ
jgi:hypothetical protein